MPPESSSNNGESIAADRVIELSFQETNALRESLGLAPLRANKKEPIDAPLPPSSVDLQAAALREQQELKRQVAEGIDAQFGHATLGAPPKETSTKAWARKLKKQQQQPAPNVQKVETKQEQSYGEQDLKGLTVGHSIGELEKGSTTVLTLSDAPLLQTNATGRAVALSSTDNSASLQNANLADDREKHDGLRNKRLVEMGMGRTNGYTGWDDDEFEELGGTQAPSSLSRGVAASGEKKSSVKGFRIGSHLYGEDEDEEQEQGASSKRKAVSLAPSKADVTANDFMTAEEDELQRKSEKASFKKKSKKDKKKKKKKKRRTQVENSDQEEEQTFALKEEDGKDLLDVLEETAVEPVVVKRRRRRDDDDDDEATETHITKPTLDKRARYEQAVAKGNERSKQAFRGSTKTFKSAIDGGDDEEPDDAFLNAALAKARRVHRLKEMKRGADAVVSSLQATAQHDSGIPTKTTNTITFAVDETQEFTRAIQARNEQLARKLNKKEIEVEEIESMQVETVSNVQEESDGKLDISELAKNMEDTADLDGTTGATVALGRGVGNVLHLLQQTGDLTAKNAGKELLRGRAKDERTYEDYQPLDLSKVVQIDRNTATAKDKEMAQREIKLEYRDSHGRLLTRKEAYRELCYQFHGHGSGKRKEEKKLEQIAREQAETSVAAAAGSGTFGALQAVQKASGKAFIIHKS